MKIVQFDSNDVSTYFEQLFELKCRSLKMSFRDGECENIEQTCREKLLELPGYIENKKAIVFGALEEDVLIGFLWAYPRTFFNQPRMFVNGIAVLENFEGTVIAKALMSELVKYSKNADYQAIDLTAAPFNENAIGFYRYLGFNDERIQMVMPLN